MTVPARERLSATDVGKATPRSAWVRSTLSGPGRQCKIGLHELPVTQKWLLVAMLTAESRPEVLKLVQARMPEINRRSLGEQAESLHGLCISGVNMGADEMRLEWLDGEYRAAVLWMLETDGELRHTFIRTASAATDEPGLADQIANATSNGH